ncbi:MAG: hypothetical protein LBE10_01630 [Treponema sp.]|jgi:hypothetical protein|nr:hypothetical protein [Treponema sp.]
MAIEAKVCEVRAKVRQFSGDDPEKNNIRQAPFMWFVILFCGGMSVCGYSAGQV